MRIVDRIIRNAVITATVIVSAVIVGIQSFLSLIQQFNYIGQGNYTIWKGLLFVLMQIPAQFYQLFPVVGFLGALIGLSRLGSTSQLIIMRASGVSVFRIAWSVLKAAIIMVIFATVLGEGVGPKWQQQSQSMQQAALSPSANNSLLQSVWLHQGNSFTHIGELTNHKEMLNVTRYRFALDGHLEKITAAKSAEFINGHWKLLNVKETTFSEDATGSDERKEAHLHVTFKPNLQVQMKIASGEQTIKSLFHTILYRRSIGLSVNQFIFSLWQRLLQPITSLVMICLSVPFVFGSFRGASVGLRILSGVLVGFLFYMLNQLFGPITLIYQFPPLLAALVPTIFFSLVAMLLLVRTK
ncbi:MAG: LPS export ABC transporter permease LptG [Gammaproteobacteria bacterium]|nr:LPS export ABC transporter permease LptG [Gammaproteobacteria bacterium]